MKYSGLATTLKLAYSPISNYDFAFLKKEKIVQQILDGSMLYIIAQRPLLTFENINRSADEATLFFDIVQQGTGYKVKCALPIYQELIGKDETKEIIFKFGSYDQNWKQTQFPFTGINGMQLYDHEENFLIWLSPDKFLHNYYNNIITAAINGDYMPLTKFNVQYVGKATDEEIWMRLTGHSTLQEILSLETPFNYGTLPTHEIALLLFRVDDKLSIRTLDGEDDIDDFVEAMMGTKNYPTDKEVSLDAEKALIKLLDPVYNMKKFPNYPISKDGLYRYEFDHFSYQISENISLVYSDGEIVCNIAESQSDIIAVQDNETLTVLRPERVKS